MHTSTISRKQKPPKKTLKKNPIFLVKICFGGVSKRPIQISSQKKNLNSSSKTLVDFCKVIFFFRQSPPRRKICLCVKGIPPQRLAKKTRVKGVKPTAAPIGGGKL